MGCSASLNKELQKKGSINKKYFQNKDEHKLPHEKLIRKMKTDMSIGLMTEEAGLRFMMKDGKNQCHDKKWKQYFEEKMPRSYRVLRDGKIKLMSSTHLVVGDIVILGPGPVPADIVVLEGNGEISKFNLDLVYTTGEYCKDISTTVEWINSPNVILFGSEIKSGFGRGVIVEVGEKRAFEVVCKSTMDRPPGQKKRPSIFDRRRSVHANKVN